MMMTIIIVMIMEWGMEQTERGTWMGERLRLLLLFDFRYSDWKWRGRICVCFNFYVFCKHIDHFLQIFLQFSENTISDDDGNLGFWANQS